MISRFVTVFLLSLSAFSQNIPPTIYQSLHWRSIGPYRAGRITAIAGVPTQPEVYYAGTPGGGVWKTTDAGQVWKPIFDAEKVASIGALAVAGSNPDIVYVGTGEQTHGNGMYRSNDAGKTWSNIGLEKTDVITSIAVDPKNPEIVLVATAGDATGADERGIYKTTNGGKDWKKVLFRDKDTSVMDMSMAPGNAKLMYASLWRRPVEFKYGPHKAEAKQDAFLYRSTDEGTTWTQVRGVGLPAQSMGRVGVAAATGKNSKTVYAIAAQGFFRSDDRGESWRQTTHDPRILGNGYFSRVFVDPSNAETVYIAQTSMYRSTDGGKTFAATFGAPSGDDFHVAWINPSDTRYMALGVDQGAIISVDGGATWSSWYNQPTGQFYHVTTDNRFPYYVYAAQQDSGTASVASRSDFGEISERDWAPAGGFEFAYIAPDPVNQNYVYIGGWYGSILRFDRTTSQIHQVFVRTAKYRTAGMAPLVFAPQNKHRLYVGTQFVMKSDDGGESWQEISPDLTVPTTLPKDAAERKRNEEAVIFTMAPSPVTANEIWAGTSNGLVQVTSDGNVWQNVTPTGLPERSSIQIIEASPHDAATAYAVVRGFGDPRPYILRTHDLGKTWQRITQGLPDDFPAYVVREDPARKGLLYAGTDNAIYISFDDGDHWQSLQLDLPTASVRDITVHDNDLVIATFGRSLWILDDLTPFRQLNPAISNETAHLFVPEKAIRARWDMNQDTPLPIETPAGQNPPDGAMIDYYLASPAKSDVKISIYDSQKKLVRDYSTHPADYDHAPANVPEYWFAPQVVVPNHAGVNRFVWDLHYPPPKTLRYSYYGNQLDYIEYTLADHAIPGETPREQPLGPLAVPGTYTVELSVDGRSYSQPLTIVPDPRVQVTQAELEAQLATQKNISSQMETTYAAVEQLNALHEAIVERQKSLPAPKVTETATAEAEAGVTKQPKAGDPLSAVDEEIKKLRDGSTKDPGFGALNRELARLASMIGSGDGKPASQLEDAVNHSCETLVQRAKDWSALTAGLNSANDYLQQHKLAPLPAVTGLPAMEPCGAR